MDFSGKNGSLYIIQVLFMHSASPIIRGTCFTRRFSRALPENGPIHVIQGLCCTTPTSEKPVFPVGYARGTTGKWFLPRSESVVLLGVSSITRGTITFFKACIVRRLPQNKGLYPGGPPEKMFPYTIFKACLWLLHQKS